MKRIKLAVSSSLEQWLPHISSKLVKALLFLAVAVQKIIVSTPH
jgi:hypothetical protein